MLGLAGGGMLILARSTSPPVVPGSADRLFLLVAGDRAAGTLFEALRPGELFACGLCGLTLTGELVGLVCRGFFCSSIHGQLSDNVGVTCSAEDVPERFLPSGIVLQVLYRRSTR
jgi:hypothetical protein